jgi:ferredoxin
MAPDRFAFDGKVSRPVDPLIAPEDRVRDAADICPMEAITVEDAATGEQLAPG